MCDAGRYADNFQRYLSLIEDRLKEVESRVNILESSGSKIAFEEPVIPVGIHVPESAPADVFDALPVRDGAENVDLIEDSIDGMGVVTFAPEEDCASFGNYIILPFQCQN